jgi:hypothetical protein
MQDEMNRKSNVPEGAQAGRFGNVLGASLEKK